MGAADTVRTRLPDGQASQPMYRCLQVQTRRSLHRVLYDEDAKEDVQVTQGGRLSKGFCRAFGASATRHGEIFPLVASICQEMQKEGRQTADTSGLTHLAIRTDARAGTTRISHGSVHAQCTSLLSACHHARPQWRLRQRGLRQAPAGHRALP